MIVAFFIIQRLLRPTKGAKSFHGGPFDRGNMLLIGSATGIGLWLPVLADVSGAFTFPINLLEGLVALAVMMIGLGVRIWAALTLGKFYTTTLMIAEDHKVVTSGPYARVRHPGYLGDMLLWAGFGVLSGNLLVMLIFAVMFVSVYLYRIRAEESILVQELGNDYVQYQRRTRKIIPFVF